MEMTELKEEIVNAANNELNLACEAVQTAAMLMKYEISLGIRESEGADE